MQTIDPGELSARDAYRLMISVIVPRPVAWISTTSPDGIDNLAPFSFFNGVSGRPPLIIVSIGRRQGMPKDTLQNIQETGEFVVNIVSQELAEAMNLTSGEWEASVDEFALAGLERAASLEIRPPRLAAARAAMECRLEQLIPMEESSYTLVLGRILRYHLQDGLLRENGLVDAALLRPLARLGGDEYARLGEIFEMHRPKA